MSNVKEGSNAPRKLGKQINRRVANNIECIFFKKHTTSSVISLLVLLSVGKMSKTIILMTGAQRSNNGHIVFEFQKVYEF